MKSLKIVKLLFGFGLLMTFTGLIGCSDPRCGGEYSFLLNNFLFHVKDKHSGNDILNVYNMPTYMYNYDTVAIYNDDWTVSTPFPGTRPDDPNRWVSLDGSVSFNFIKDQDKGVVNKRISRMFFMYFNYQDIDTIAIEFEMKLDKCDDQIMKYFKVAYNDSIYFDGPTELVPYINFLK